MKNDLDMDDGEKKNLLTKFQSKKRMIERIFFNYLNKVRDIIFQEKIYQSRIISLSKAKQKEYLIILNTIEVFLNIIEAEADLLKK